MEHQHTQSQTPETLRIDEVAKVLRVHPETVRRRLVAGEIYGIRLGSTWRIPAQELDRLLDGRPSLSKGVLDDDDALIAMAIRNF